MNKLKLRKNLFILFSSIALYSAYRYATRYEANYKILEDESIDAYASYVDGLIYIGDFFTISDLIDQVNEGDILVIDKRLSDDPDMKILDSYRITDVNDIKDILNCLIEYESENPTLWDRTLTSMVTEWKAHNFLYRINYQRCRTTDVDLNNEDEDVYNSIFLRKMFYR